MADNDNNQKTVEDWKNNIPANYEAAVETTKSLKNDIGALEAYINGLLLHSQELYDHSGTGIVAPTKEEHYKLIKESNTPVKNNQCAPAHQLVANILNDAGIPSRVVFAKSEEGGHAIDIASPKRSYYIASDYGNESIVFRASSVLEGVKLAKTLLPFVQNEGYNAFASKDGKHLQYKEFALGDMIRQDKNPDKNGIPSLDAPNSLALEEAPLQNTFGLKTQADVSAKEGYNPYFGNYNSNTLSLKLKGSANMGKGWTSKLDLGAQTGVVNTSMTTPWKTGANVTKSAKYLYGGFNAGALVSTPDLTKNSAVETKGFVYTGGNFNFVETNGTIKYNSEPNKNASTSFNDFSVNLFAGGTAKINTPHTQTQFSAYAGPRLVEDMNVYDQSVGVAPEFVAGAQMGFSAHAQLGDIKLTSATNASAAHVDARFYDKNVLNAETKLSLQAKDGALYGYSGLNLSDTKFDGFEDKDRQIRPYAGVGLEASPAKNYSVGADYQFTKGGYGAMMYLKTNTAFW